MRLPVGDALALGLALEAFLGSFGPLPLQRFVLLQTPLPLSLSVIKRSMDEAKLRRRRCAAAAAAAAHMRALREVKAARRVVGREVGRAGAAGHAVEVACCHHLPMPRGLSDQSMI